ncbi:hypothetical protein IB67_10415 [Fervidobacterium riparium]|uniref:UPF0102 protein SAMN02745226_00168 n=1 Tax=Fervidobacterium gondwanense DSM 13020 TaxID=1121883 RepID=A0A1M7RU96_FERGO|nr:hypothetical protein IB67_10415 [Fervidobacterium riparium]SHN49784.1 putative endonuclease [Fervidobacterium gondwanense DSM 13020]
MRTFLKKIIGLSKSRVFTDNSKVKEWQKSEELAAQYLKKKGYKIESRNYRTPFGEIDIIAKKGNMYVFVEVKSGTGRKIRPSERVDENKHQRICKVAEYYIHRELKKKRRDDFLYKTRIDVIEIIDGKITHYENIGWDFV